MIVLRIGADWAWNRAATTQPATTTFKKNHPRICSDRGSDQFLRRTESACLKVRSDSVGIGGKQGVAEGADGSDEARIFGVVPQFLA